MRMRLVARLAVNVGPGNVHGGVLGGFHRFDRGRKLAGERLVCDERVLESLPWSPALARVCHQDTLHSQQYSL